MKNYSTRILTGMLLLVGGAFIFFYLPPLYFSIVLIIILFLILYFELPLLFAHNPLLWLLTPLYPIVPFILMIWMNHQQARILLFIQLLLVASCDTGAYVVGNLYGRHKLAPSISPGKSLEGFIGGYISCFLMLVIIMLYCCAVNLFFCIWFSGLLTVVATMGDLFESLLKRKAKIKDSGFIVPGHGGLLDRFDAQLFGTILFFIFMTRKPQGF